MKKSGWRPSPWAEKCTPNAIWKKLVTRLGRRFLQAVIDGGYVFTQQFDPFTGAPCRVGMISHQVLPEGSSEPFQDAYGPTLLSVLEYIAHSWGVHIQMGEVWFSLGSGEAYEYEQVWNGHAWRIESNRRTARILIDGEVRYEEICGQRIITDENGTRLRKVFIK